MSMSTMAGPWCWRSRISSAACSRWHTSCYAAPVLLAEVALDAALVAGIYRKLRKEDARYWLGSALRHTWLPAVIAAVCL